MQSSSWANSKPHTGLLTLISHPRGSPISDLRFLWWVCTAGVNCEMYSTEWTERSITDIEWQIDLFTGYNSWSIMAVGSCLNCELACEPEDIEKVGGHI